MEKIKAEILRLMGEDIEEYYAERDEVVPFNVGDPKNEDEITKTHAMIERDIADCGFKAMTNNCFEIRTLILKDYLKTEESLEDREFTFVDVNLSAIAEYLGEVTIEEIKNQLGYYGNWEIINFEGMNYLIIN